MALRPTKGMLTGSKETKTLPGESGPFDPNAGTPTSLTMRCLRVMTKDLLKTY